MIPALENAHITVAGATGSGKSHLAGAILEQYYLQGRPWVCLDTKQFNHYGLYNLKHVKLLRVSPSTFYNFEKALNYPYLLCIPDRRTKTKELISIYKQFLEIAYDSRSPKAYLLEEAHLYNPSPNYPDGIIELITREGRGYNMNSIFVTQRIQDFPKLLWSQCKFSYLYKALIPQDVRYISSFIPNFQNINWKLREHEAVKYYHNENKFLVLPAAKIQRITPHYG